MVAVIPSVLDAEARRMAVAQNRRGPQSIYDQAREIASACRYTDSRIRYAEVRAQPRARWLVRSGALRLNSLIFVHEIFRFVAAGRTRRCCGNSVSRPAKYLVRRVAQRIGRPERRTAGGYACGSLLRYVAFSHSEYTLAGRFLRHQWFIDESRYNQYSGLTKARGRIVLSDVFRYRIRCQWGG